MNITISWPDFTSDMYAFWYVTFAVATILNFVACKFWLQNCFRDPILNLNSTQLKFINNVAAGRLDYIKKHIEMKNTIYKVDTVTNNTIKEIKVLKPLSSCDRFRGRAIITWKATERGYEKCVKKVQRLCTPCKIFCSPLTAILIILRGRHYG